MAPRKHKSKPKPASQTARTSPKKSTAKPVSDDLASPGAPVVASGPAATVAATAPDDVGPTPEDLALWESRRPERPDPLPEGDWIDALAVAGEAWFETRSRDRHVVAYRAGRAINAAWWLQTAHCRLFVANHRAFHAQPRGAIDWSRWRRLHDGAFRVYHDLIEAAFALDRGASVAGSEDPAAASPAGRAGEEIRRLLGDWVRCDASEFFPYEDRGSDVDRFFFEFSGNDAWHDDELPPRTWRFPGNDESPHYGELHSLLLQTMSDDERPYYDLGIAADQLLRGPLGPSCNSHTLYGWRSAGASGPGELIREIAGRAVRLGLPESAAARFRATAESGRLRDALEAFGGLESQLCKGPDAAEPTLTDADGTGTSALKTGSVVSSEIEYDPKTRTLRQKGMDDPVELTPKQAEQFEFVLEASAEGRRITTQDWTDRFGDSKKPSGETDAPRQVKSGLNRKLKKLRLQVVDYELFALLPVQIPRVG